MAITDRATDLRPISVVQNKQSRVLQGGGSGRGPQVFILLVLLRTTENLPRRLYFRELKVMRLSWSMKRSHSRQRLHQF
jgi:hypothetical protein